MSKHEKYPTSDRAEQRMRDDAAKGKPSTGQTGRHDAGTAPVSEDKPSK